MDKHWDVVVVGAGMAGLTARTTAAAGAATLVVGGLLRLLSDDAVLWSDGGPPAGPSATPSWEPKRTGTYPQVVHRGCLTW